MKYRVFVPLHQWSVYDVDDADDEGDAIDEVMKNRHGVTDPDATVQLDGIETVFAERKEG